MMALAFIILVLVSLTWTPCSKAEIDHNYPNHSPPQASSGGSSFESFLSSLQKLDKNQSSIKVPFVSEDTLIFEVLNSVGQSRELTTNSHLFVNPRDKEILYDKNLISPSKCNDDLNFLLEQLSLLNQPNPIVSEEVLAFFDSYAAPEAGILSGNLHWTGYYKACTDRRVTKLNRTTRVTEIKFDGRYCVGSLKSPNWLNAGDNSNNQAPSDRDLRVRVGICLPDSCDSKLIEPRYNDIKSLIDHRGNRVIKFFKLVEVFCEPDEGSELRKFNFSTWLFLLFATSWITIVIAATKADSKLKITNSRNGSHGNSNGEVKVVDKYHLLSELISCLSIVSSVKYLSGKYKQILKIRTGCRKKRANESNLAETNRRLGAHSSDLLFLDSLQVICMGLIIYCTLAFSQTSLSKYPIRQRAYSHFIWQFLTGSNSLMDCLLVISGFATAYKLSCNGILKRNNLLDWAYLIFQRYLRLAPVYLLTFWFAKSLFKNTGYGPLWDYGTASGTLRNVCENQSWLWPLTLTSNFHSISNECNISSWYVSVQMQLFLIAPLLLIVLQKSTIIGCLLSWGLVCLGSLLKLYRHINDPVAKRSDLIRLGHVDYINQTEWPAASVSLQTQFKLPAYVIGLLGGHFAFMVMSGNWNCLLCTKRQPRPQNDRSKFISLFVRFCLIITSGVMFMSNYLFKAYSLESNNIPALLYPIWVNSMPMGTVLAITMLTFQMPTRNALTRPFWNMLNKLSYCAYIIHFDVLYWFMQYKEKLGEFENWDLHKIMTTIIWLSFYMGMLLYFFVELPIRKLEKRMVRPILNPNFKKQKEN